MLVLDSVSLTRGGRLVLDQVSLTLAPGEMVGLLGANGAGKSSMLALLAGDLKPQSGAITINGTRLEAVAPRAQARQRAFLTQQSPLQFDLGVDEVVAMGAYPFETLSQADVTRLVHASLTMTSTAELAGRRYMDLSAGEQQRVHFARALLQCRAQRTAGEPRYLLLDEPTASQDPGQQQQVLATAAHVAHDEQIGVLAVLHDINLAARWCDRIVLLAGSRVVENAAPELALTAASLQQVYGINAVVTPHPLHPARVLVMLR